MRRRTISMAAVLLAFVWVVAVPASPRAAHAATRYLDPIFNVDVQHDVVYGNTVNIDGTPVTLQLDLYTPRGDTAMKRPVFIFAHGGFFVLGDKSGSFAWATRMAKAGYVAASINYRLGPVAVVAPVDTQLEFDIVNNARADMQTAVRWFRANADSLRIDPDRIAVAGSSAGAVTALGVAVNADAPLPGDHADVSSAVCTAVAISGANDPAAIGPGDAGALFQHGTVDDIVPYAQAVATRDAMVAAGLPVSWNEIPGEGHSLSSAALDALVPVTVRWLYDHVANATYPCSPAVAKQPRVPAGRQTTVRGGLAGRSGIVSLISVENEVPGFVQALPCGATAGGSSNLNTDRADQIRSVLAVVPFDGAGTACLFNQARSHLVADLQGWFTPGSFDDVADVRLLDTRTGARPATGSQTLIHGRPNTTAVVSLVATETTAPGFVQVLPCGTAPGAYSNLNVDAAGQTRAGLAFVRFDEQGSACVFVQTSTHLVVDLQGYLAASAFDDIADARILDTRSGPIPASGSQTVITGRANSTAVVSLVATDTTGPGYVQVLPCGATPGASSNLNTDAAGQIIAGMAMVRFGADGRACVFTQTSTHLVVDVQGWFTPGSFDDVADVRLLDTRVK
jgi:acetyl esterase/lipase